MRGEGRARGRCGIVYLPSRFFANTTNSLQTSRHDTFSKVFLLSVQSWPPTCLRLQDGVS